MDQKLKIIQTKIPGVIVVDTTPFVDHRGSFARFFCENELASILGKKHIIQINHSRTSKVGAVRGIHFQYPPYAEMKLVRCIRGKVFDVAVDLRKYSPTFLSWHAEELDPAAAKMLVIPEGCAHGFQVLEEDSELLYLHTQQYRAESEGGIRPTDPAIAIDWPLPVKDISQKDAGYPLITPSYKGMIP